MHLGPPGVEIERNGATGPERLVGGTVAQGLSFRLGGAAWLSEARRTDHD
jgi:hypothetical protein